MTEENNYYQNFKIKNSKKIKEKKICDICGGNYTYYNKSHHIKTQKHRLHLYLPEELKKQLL